MLHVIGLILKIFGIILAVLLGIIALLVCIVLFVSVRYEISAEFPGKLEDMTAKVKFSWLLHLISGEAGYRENAFYWNVRAAWIKFNIDEEKTAENVTSEVKEEINATVDTIAEKPETVEKEEKTKKQEKIEKPEIGENAEEKIIKTEKISFFQKIKNRIKAVWEKIKDIFLKICDIIKNIREIKNKITDFLTDKTHIQAFYKVKKEFKWMLRFLKPKKFDLNLHYGFDDPYRTGQVLAGLSMIYPFVGDNMKVQPDFEQQIIEGNLYVKGKLRMIYPVIYLIRLILDKNVRRTFIDGKNFKFK